MKAIKITPMGPMENSKVEQVEVNGYQETVDHLGGSLEGLTLSDDASAYVDEEGKLKELAYNRTATKLCTRLETGLASSDFICGTMLIFGAPDSEGDETDVPDRILSEIKAIHVESN